MGSAFPAVISVRKTTVFLTPLFAPTTSRGDAFSLLPPSAAQQTAWSLVTGSVSCGGSPEKTIRPLIVAPFFTPTTLYPRGPATAGEESIIRTASRASVRDPMTTSSQISVCAEFRDSSLEANVGSSRGGLRNLSGTCCKLLATGNGNPLHPLKALLEKTGRSRKLCKPIVQKEFDRAELGRFWCSF